MMADPNIPPDMMNEALRQALLRDLGEAQATSRRTATSLGVDEPSDFSPRALRLSGKAIGGVELTASKRAIERAVRELSANSKLADQKSLGFFKHNMPRKLNQ